jgi:general secretion pathway protein K
MKPMNHSASSAQGKQEGAALLLAMLIVTLVASVAASGLWLQWQSVEVERKERLRQQLSWLMVGAFDWSRLIVNEDHKADRNSNNLVDHLAEPWAIPLKEVRLSAFLSRDKVVREGDPDVILSGHMHDEQGKINLNGLLGSEHADQALIWERLFLLLELPANDWRTLRAHAERERLVRSGKTLDAGQQALQVFWPLRTADLPQLGLSAASLERLQAFVTVLPDWTSTINVNTASAEVLYASLDGTDWAQAQDLVRKRASAPWKTLADLEKTMGRSTPLNTKRLGVRTDFFLLTGQLRIEELRLQESALVSRKTQPPTLVWRAQTAAKETPSQIRMADQFSP